MSAVSDVLGMIFQTDPQKQTSARLKISPQYWNDVLKGRRDLSVELAVKLERIYYVNARDLLIRQLDEQLELHRKLCRIKP